MDESLLPNQDTGRNPKKNPDDIVCENIPKKRKWWRAWLASVIICLLTATGIIYHGFVENETIEYKQVSDLSTTKLEAIKNGSIKIYTREEKKTYPVLFNLGLAVLAIILGTFVDRLSLVVEELFHFKSRYNRSIRKMLKACFSGISWRAVVLVIVLVVIICIIIPLVDNATFELRHLTYILSGIGVGPLVMHLLNLNTQSEVYISTILEEKETYVANGLAWSYYFNYLDKAVPKFHEKIPNNSGSSVQLDQGEHVYLSLNKLILLISHDCTTTDNLGKLDNKITKLGEISNGKYIFPVYRLTDHSREYIYVIKYVMQPLETLEKMSQYGRIKALDDKQLEYQVKLLCRTLSEILKKPFNKECKEKCILVPIKAKSRQSLNNGGLVSAIMHKVKADESTLEHVDGFMIVLSTGKTEQPKATEDDTPHLDGKIVANKKVTINPVEGRAQYSKQDPPIDNQDENKPLEQANTLERSEEPVNVQLPRKYKGKSSRREREPMLHAKQDRECKGTKTISMLSKGQAEMDDPKESGGIEETDQCLVDGRGEGYGRRPAMNDGQPISGHTAETGSHPTSGNPENGRGNSPREDSLPVFNRTGETENQSMSSDFMDEENCLREEVDNGRPALSYNPPASDHIRENQNQPMSSHLMDDGENSPGGNEEDKGSMSSTSMNGGVPL